MLAFTCQLYFDFSGYVDMALGSALMLNIRMPGNFNSPLRARSLIEFWSRWHMTLTNFLTTYIYTPILYAFRRVTFARSLVAVFVTFFISGIWHGAAWTFVAFGAAHGAVLALNHAWRRARLPMPAALGWLLTFVFVSCTFVLFRAKSLGDAGKVFSGLAGLEGPGAAIEPFVGALVAISFVVIFAFPNSGRIAARFRSRLGGNAWNPLKSSPA
jgi:D-alanyl-lipoteichoic acid acyltransferase DltB (MBOAT superfamily)